MQVHAVPENERAYDSTGKQLPWAIEYADDPNPRRVPRETGSFGRPTRKPRSMSRSKTGTPARGSKEDLAKLEHQRVIDDIITASKADLAKENARKQTTAIAPAPLGESTNAVNALLPTQTAPVGEPVEVILYGFGSEAQWAAIAFYERVSGGVILEDYDREPPSARYDMSLSLGRQAAQRSLSQAALRKKNAYMGGDHWIKVTFDSALAADQACYCSPHRIEHYLVTAERYRGKGPERDTVVFASMGQANGASLTGSPSRVSSTTLQAGTSPTSSATASSATATVTATSSATYAAATHPQQRRPFGHSTLPDDHPLNQLSTPGAPALSTTGKKARPDMHSASLVQPPPLKVRGAKRAVLLPADQALLPVAPRWQQTIKNIPLVGLLFGGGSEFIEAQVPRTADGGLDWAKAGWYWTFWGYADRLLGTDFCGLKEDE
ncbi:hypothetical protein M501DRAFT_932488 [Patellaria atrata CBS 101060]|uniref:Uncharacterized protein n=1 Tax=Patellaria atrata CBS 101060 TaxID=1346257 RepID=A0A9P4VTS4_9PEZI|nr:hypothetical protein M501DRAFT_932488 [Patellaria atrata CBS 101060]